MPVSERTKKEIWAKSAARCAICRELLIDTSLGSENTSLIGEIAHIVAAGDIGPRADTSLPVEYKSSAMNLLLLCLKDHKLIDDHPEKYSVAELTEIKKRHENWVEQRLSNGTPWKCNVHNLFYLNIPRLGMLAKFLGYSTECQPYFHLNDLRPLGGELIRVLMFFEDFLGKLHPASTEFSELPVGQEAVGRVVSFNENFRTKNVGKALDSDRVRFIGDLKKDPHIYCNKNGYKLALPIDIRWLTTTTAGVYFCTGISRFSGICIVNTVDEEKKLLLASPLIIGQPRNEELAAVFGDRY